MKKKGVKSEEKIQNLFASKPPNLTLLRDVIVGDMNADYFIQSPTGTSSIFQIKHWDPTEENKDRARYLVTLYKLLSNSNNAYIILPGLDKSDPEHGVIAPEYISSVFRNLSDKTKKHDSKLPKIRKAPNKTVFAAMPFSQNYDDTFEVGIQGACLALGYKAIRVDHQEFTGDIVAEIKKLIRRSVAIIGDLSESRPNVLYEVGLAHAAKRDVIQICSTPMSNIPFDVRNNRTLQYEKGRTGKLRDVLIKELKALLPEI